MNTVKLLLAALVTLLICDSSLPAQDRFFLTFQGTAWSTDASGKNITRIVNNRTWLQDYVQSNGITNDIRSLALVYHVNADERGDVIEIVSTNADVAPFPLYGLFFGEFYGRMAYTNSDGSITKRIDYVYNHQIDHSIGTALTTKRFTHDHNGNTIRTFIQGQINYTVLPDANHATLELGSGTFTASRPAPVSTNTPPINPPPANGSP